MSDGALDRITIFDTTLRDGEQSPGASMNQAQKLQVATALEELGVDVIELGFPVASPGDFEAVRAIARSLEGPVMCALARATREDIDVTWEALKDAPRRRIHTFLATSPLHRQYKLGLEKSQVVERAVDAVLYARDRFEDVQFSAEDAARTELDFLAEVAERVIEAGATTLNIPDTVGYAMPQQFAATVRYLKQHVRGIEKVVLSVHCHDDLGLAVANSLAAVMEGARQVECTINGIGERAGNCSLEEAVMAITTRADFFKARTGIRTQRLYPTSRLLSNVTGLPVQRNKAVVGQNAFAHEAGIHQHGVLKHAATYEIMKPEDVGFSKNSLVLGKHSGRHILRQRVHELGYRLTEAEVDTLFAEFKKLADKKRELFDADLEALILGQMDPARVTAWELVSLTTVTSTEGPPRATVKLTHSDGRIAEQAETGDGPVDAIFKAIERITGTRAVLRAYQISSKGSGEDAQGEVQLELEHEKGVFLGRAVNTDILVGSALAFLEALNRITTSRQGPMRAAGGI